MCFIKHLGTTTVIVTWATIPGLAVWQHGRTTKGFFNHRLNGHTQSVATGQWPSANGNVWNNNFKLVFFFSTLPLKLSLQIWKYFRIPLTFGQKSLVIGVLMNTLPVWELVPQATQDNLRLPDSQYDQLG